MDLQSIIGDVVAEDYRTATVFKKFGIDFCCRGNKSIEAACVDLNVDPRELAEAIEEARRLTDRPATDYNQWSLDRLCRHIEDVHHTYVRTRIPELELLLNKVVSKHGEDHPELLEIASHFSLLRNELTSHMPKEEQILFPFIIRMAEARREGRKCERPPFGSVQFPITVMEAEHENAGSATESIRTLSSGFTPPDSACNSYRVLFKLLEEFENDLNLHIHLENNILFPKAIELEKLALE